jgi:uncharacterized membrane protein
MGQSNKRALTVALIVVGALMLVLGGVMLATFPWQQGTFPFAHMWAQAPGSAQVAPPSAAPDGQQGGQQGLAPGQGLPRGWPGGWYGYHHGFFMHGPRFFGGGLLILVLVIVAISFFARRFWYWGSWRHDEPGRGLTAEEILRRKFAQGDISEEEYKSRLSALGK